MRHLFCLVSALCLILLGCGGGGPGQVNTVVSVTVSPATDTFMNKGNTVQYTAVGTFTNGATQDITSRVTWTSSSKSVATIAANGIATTVAAGTTTITATTSADLAPAAITGTATLTFVGLKSISISPSSLSLSGTSTSQLEATGTFTNGETKKLTEGVTWASSNEAVATISNTSPTQGIVTAVSAGTTLITAAEAGTNVTSPSIVVTVTQ